ncbi:hypothetical protein ACQ3G6_07030 [Allorhizobium undicola]
MIEPALQLYRAERLSRDMIAAHALFPEVERRIWPYLSSVHGVTPRLSRLKASHRKGLMTHALFALALQRDSGDPLSGLTATRFIEIVMQVGAASRNTAAAFLSELLAYKFLQDAEGVTDRRVRVLILTDTSLKAMRTWFHGHLECLDLLDGGNRLALAKADDRIFFESQPIIARALLADEEWRVPRETINHFLGSDMGGLILHDLISRMPDHANADARYLLGPVSLTRLGDSYLVSSTNLKRMFKKAESEGLLGWEQARRRGNLWLSRDFVADYFHWQAAKFEAVNNAFIEVCNQLGIEEQAPEQTSNAA